MTTVASDLTPAPAPVGRLRAVWVHARTETGLLLSNGEQLLLAVMIPLGVLVLGHYFGRSWLDLDQLTGSVMAMAVWSTAFTATAISTGFERRYGVLERFAATPLTPLGLIGGKALSVIMITVGQLVVLAIVAVLLGWRPALSPLSAVLLLTSVVFSMISFVCFALAMAGQLRAEITLALANVVHLVMVVGGGLVIPLANHPPGLAAVIGALPTGSLGEAFRLFSAGAQPATSLGWLLLVNAVWAIVSVVVARKAFRWM